MSDDLVKRLRKDALSQEQLWTLRDAAADRIEALEAALKNVGILAFGASEDIVHVIRAALAGEKKDDHE